MKVVLTLSLIFVVMLLQGCGEVFGNNSVENGYGIKFLAEKDGCKVYSVTRSGSNLNMFVRCDVGDVQMLSKRNY